MTMKTTNIQGLADALGLAKSTVSKALNDRPDVGEKTKRRVRAVVAKRGYRRSRLAQALSTQRTAMVGLLMGTVERPFFAELTRALVQGMSEAGYRVVIDASRDALERQSEIVTDFLSWSVEGIILVPCQGTAASFLEGLSGKTRLVTVDNRIRGAGVPFVGTDFSSAVDQAVTYLLALGHRRIGYVGGPPEMTGARERKNGFRKAFKRAGLRPQRGWMVESAFARAPAAEAARRVLAGAPELTALVCASAGISAGAYDAVLAGGRRVPEDLSLVDIGSEQVMTTLDQKSAEIGRTAARTLCRLIGGKRVRARTIIEPELVVRHTTKRLGVRGTGRENKKGKR